MFFTWALSNISFSKTISVQSFVDIYVFRVCRAKEQDCSLCGTVESKGNWMTVFCPKGGLIGSFVTAEEESHSGVLDVCECEIYGEGLD